ncbi:hypothetical protein ALQ51_102317 [Pseudomonas cannabina]|uniref:Uncharacterized protein n=1 Tax=Pseudomonas cannabina TaxID=86840 RepID=A0A3M3RWI0_PSECA|nr:hypothetical protein ALQ51_102317 [Pseudomonas cannabina]
MLGLQDPFSAAGREIPAINATVATSLEPLKPDAFLGANQIST